MNIYVYRIGLDRIGWDQNILLFQELDFWRNKYEIRYTIQWFDNEWFYSSRFTYFSNWLNALVVSTLDSLHCQRASEHETSGKWECNILNRLIYKMRFYKVLSFLRTKHIEKQMARSELACLSCNIKYTHIPNIRADRLHRINFIGFFLLFLFRKRANFSIWVGRIPLQSNLTISLAWTSLYYFDSAW